MIVSVYGTCDGKEIVFHKVTGEQWQCVVPADLSDGTYVVEIWAVAYEGFVVYTTAILYMCDARFARLELVDDIQVKIAPDKYKMHISTSEPLIITDDGLKIRIKVKNYRIKVVQL